VAKRRGRPPAAPFLLQDTRNKMLERLKFFLLGGKAAVISLAHKRTEGRAPVWGSEFASKEATLLGGSSRNRCYAEREKRGFWFGPSALFVLEAPFFVSFFFSPIEYHFSTIFRVKCAISTIEMGASSRLFNGLFFGHFQTIFRPFFFIFRCFFLSFYNIAGEAYSFTCELH
jgi:hypothetical protein